VVDIFARGTLNLDRVRDWLTYLSMDWNDVFRNERRARAFFNGRNVIRAVHWMMAGRDDIPNRESVQSGLQATPNDTCRSVFSA